MANPAGGGKATPGRTAAKTYLGQKGVNMPRRCSVCVHPDRSSIDAALVERRPFRDLAGRFRLSSTALHRHAQRHVPATLAQARQAQEVARGDDLLAQVEELKDRAMGVLARAEAAEDLRAAISAIREARGCVELLARMVGELREGQTVNIIMTPEWGRARGVILAALADHPDARVSVALALEEIHDAGA